MNDQTPVRRNHDPLNFTIEHHERDVTQTLSRAFTDPKKAAHDLDNLGKMSAEAVLTQYEAAAIAVEDMGISVKDMVNKLGEALIECAGDMKHITETAIEIREKGKHSQALIERVNALSKSIRDTCAEFKKQTGA